MSAEDITRRATATRIARRIKDELFPLCDAGGAYDCCGCSTYYDIAEHAQRIALEEGT